MRQFLAAVLLLGCSLWQLPLQAAGGGFGSAGGEVEFLPVEVAYQLAVEPVGDRDLRLYWQIADGYYLYQHRFAFELAHAGENISLEPTFPPALEREDEFFGQVQVYYQQADINLRLDEAVERATLSVTSQGCADAGLCYPPRKQYFEVDFSAGTAAVIAMPERRRAESPPVVSNPQSSGLLYMLLLALLGGAVLNLMPCVFPILTLKVLSFTNSSDHDRHLHSWLYAAGVVVSFVLVAALLIALQLAGNAIGWGFQLQSPAFVIGLAYLFLAMGLSLSGMVEFGGRVMNLGSGLVASGGLRGSFFTGVLAVVVASPCTAPFMGTALGYAVTQPPQVALLVFAALGMGMAAPLLLFSYSGLARKLMPKPGAWMDTFRQLLAFPLYGTAIWLLWVAGRQTGVNSMAIALSGALALTLGLWLWRFSGWRKLPALALVVGAIAIGMGRGLDQTAASGQLPAGTEAWSEQRVAELRASGKPVFVDVTAAWCITCIANEQAVLHRADISAAFAANRIAYLVADWTNYDPNIATLLEFHQRAGIPLYLLYPADQTLPPLVLPQILRKTTVLQAIDEITRKSPVVARRFDAK